MKPNDLGLLQQLHNSYDVISDWQHSADLIAAVMSIYLAQEHADVLECNFSFIQLSGNNVTLPSWNYFHSDVWLQPSCCFTTAAHDCSHQMTRTLHSQTDFCDLLDTESQTAKQLPPLDVEFAPVVWQWREQKLHLTSTTCGIQRTRAAIDFKVN